MAEQELIPHLFRTAFGLDSLLTTLYLLFSEGYYSESREEIMQEA